MYENTEFNIEYDGATYTSYLNKSEDNVEYCRSSCRNMGAKHFSWITYLNSPSLCKCNTANKDKIKMDGAISGNTTACVGEYGMK